jgi:4-hydroxy-tetrahydrodipicolinate synthase
LQNYWNEKNITKVQKINLKLAKLHQALFIESSPGPVKYAAELLNLCKSETRLPLVPIKEVTKKIVNDCLIEVGLI